MIVDRVQDSTSRIQLETKHWFGGNNFQSKLNVQNFKSQCFLLIDDQLNEHNFEFSIRNLFFFTATNLFHINSNSKLNTKGT